MAKKLDRTNLDQMTTKANEMFEGIEITEEDFAEQFDNHNIKPSMEFRSDRAMLEEEGSRCNKYDPCPICFKCRIKGSHLYSKCDSCSINLCVHDNRTREMMIKRDNFSQQIGPELMDALKELGQKHCPK